MDQQVPYPPADRGEIFGMVPSAAEFEETTVLVVGGTGGIGSQIANTLASEGAKIVFSWCTNRSGSTALERRLNENGARSVSSVRVHLNHEGAVGQLLDAVAGDGRAVLAFCAGTGPFAALVASDRRVRDRALQVNCGAFVDLVSSGRFGSAIALTSLGTSMPIPNYGLVGLTKAALEASVRYLALEMAGTCNVNAISSGFVPTKSAMIVARSYLHSDETPSLGTALVQDVARTAVWLLSDAARALTGEIITVDQGLRLGLLWRMFDSSSAATRKKCEPA